LGSLTKADEHPDVAETIGLEAEEAAVTSSTLLTRV